MSNLNDLQCELENFENSPEGWGFELRLSLADIIVKYLRKHGWSQKKLAHVAGVKEPYITRLVKGESNCTFSTAGKILYALGAKSDVVEIDRVVGNSAFDSGTYWIRSSRETLGHGEKEGNQKEGISEGEEIFTFNRSGGSSELGTRPTGIRDGTHEGFTIRA
jgi:transcriptional regulator with XRE-family HTH domain